MIAICKFCGNSKEAPHQFCIHCKKTPKNDDDIALSFILTDNFLDIEKLIFLSKKIKNGEAIPLPPDLKKLILTTINAERIRHSELLAQKKNNLISSIKKIGGIFIILICAFFLFFLNYNKNKDESSWKEAFSINTIESYRYYLDEFPKGKYRISAKNRLSSFEDKKDWDRATKANSLLGYKNYLQKHPSPFGENYKLAHDKINSLEEELYWKNIEGKKSIENYRDYLRKYPLGKYSELARTEITKLSDSYWKTISNTRSENTIKYFLKNFPESNKTKDANNRLIELYNDFEWIKEQDKISYYKRFISEFPNHEKRNWIEKRIIDIEVIEIAKGEYGEIPKATPIDLGGINVEISIENRTGYELTVRYSGIDSKKIVIPAQKTHNLSLKPGTYKIAASVNSRNVRNYYGEDTMVNGYYNSSFYISSLPYKSTY